jgi:hypothetical protein
LANPCPDDEPTSAASLFKLKATKCRHQRIQRKIKKKLNNSGGIHKQISGLEKKAKKVPRFFSK